MAEEDTKTEGGLDLSNLELNIGEGSSGLTIYAKLSEKYNCGEFTLNDKPQPIFISPWMQFEPSKMADERARVAYEIARRAVAFPRLLNELDSNQKLLKQYRDVIALLRDQQIATFDLWREERKKFGLDPEFKDMDGKWPDIMLKS